MKSSKKLSREACYQEIFDYVFDYIPKEVQKDFNDLFDIVFWGYELNSRNKTKITIGRFSRISVLLLCLHTNIEVKESKNYYTFDLNDYEEEDNTPGYNKQ